MRRWGILFSHPRDFTPVCTTELGRAAKLAPEFAKCNIKLIALSIDDVSDHLAWCKPPGSSSMVLYEGEVSHFAEDLKKWKERYTLKVITPWKALKAKRKKTLKVPAHTEEARQLKGKENLQLYHQLTLDKPRRLEKEQPLEDFIFNNRMGCIFTKAALQHIENKLAVAPISIAGLESVMEKKPSISTTRKISRKDCRSSSQNKESCFRKPLRVTTLDSNVSKNGHVEFRQPLASFRDSRWSPSCKTSCQLEDKRLNYKEAGNKAEGIGMIYDKGEPDLHGRDLKSSSSTDETVVCYLNDHPAINALQSSDVVNPTKLEEEKSEESRGDEYTKISPSSIIQNELKELQLVESSTSSASTSSAHRLDILKQHQHDDKLEKLKERIGKQWECPEELTTRGHDPEYSDYPITVAAPENIVTPKVRKVAIAPMAPSYKGFNPSEAKIRTPDGKVWCEEEFLNLSRELCRDLEFQLADGANTISTTSWWDGQRLEKKILGPVPKLEQSNTQILSSDRSEKDKFIKSVSSAQITETDCNMPVAVKPLTKCPERSWSKIRAKNNLKKKDAAPHNGGLGTHPIDKYFLPVEIRGILDDLQLDSVVQDSERRNEECQNQESEPSPFSRSHSPSKKKSDKVPISEDTQFILKKRHYDADEVRQYIMRQQEERKKRQSEEKKAQKEATEQKNKRLKELYKKQKEAVASKTKRTSTSETVTKQLQETYSKLFLEQTLLENPALSVQEVQSKPGYQPSGESDKENKAQERPVSASSSSDMSLSEPPHPLISGTSSSSLKEEPASKKLPYEHQTMELTHHSSRSPSSGSSRTSTSSKRRGRKEKTDPLNGFPNASLWEESKVSPGPDYGLEQAKHLLSSNTVSSREQEVNPDSDNSLEELSGHSLMSLPDKVRSPRTINSAQSPNIQKKMDPVGNTAEKHRSLNCPRNIASGSVLNPAFSDLSIGNNRTGTNILNGSMRFLPAGLQHRMSAELNYLSTIEQSVRQISDIPVERVRGISLAQQESVSLALILKSQQQRHERDLTLLKLKAEQELLENQRNLEEAKQKAAQAHAESLHHLAHSHQEAAETLQETTSKIATHQLETALLTADTALQIREMTELARFQISDAVGNTAAPVTTLFDQEQKHNSAFIKQLKLRNMNRKADSITTPPGKEETNDSKHHDLHVFDSYSESSRSKAHYQSSSSSRQESPSSKEAKKLSHEKPSSSIEEEAPTAMNDSLQNNSIPSVPDERDCRSSSQNKESCFRKPLRVTTLDSNVSKNGHVEFRQPLASFRDSRWSPSCKTSCQLEDKRLKYKEAGNKAEGIGMIYDKGEPDLHGRDLKSSSSTDETVVCYLNDHPAINALQSSDVVNPTKLEEEKSEESRGDEYTKISPSSIIQNELKELQLVESSTSSASTSSAHRLDILKQHQHDDKLEKLKERIRKQWECPEELTTRGHDPEYSDYPITVAAPENIVTPKVRKVAIARMAPSYKGFNPSEAKIRTPDGKVWCEEEFLNLSRELCRDLEFQLAEEDLPAIKIPTERKKKKGHKPVRKTQKIAQLSSPYFKSDGANTISTTSWRDGQRLAKKILGPVPKLEQSNTQILSSDRSEKDKFIKSDCRSSSQNKESCFRKPLRVTTLDSNVSKNGHVEFRQPLASFRDSRWSPSCKTSCQLEDKRLKYKEAGNKAEGIGMIYDKGEPDLHGRDLKSSSSTDETVVRYLNDHTAIYALQSSDVVNPTKLEEEKSEESRGDEYTKISPSSIIQNELKELQLVESSTSSASTSSAHRLDILKQHQHDDKLEKLKERIRKQWECPEELTTRGRDPEYSDYPITVAAPENIVTPKVRKVAIARMAPSYKGFNPSKAKIRTPDGKVWCEEEFLNLSRELCRDLEFQLAEEDLPAIKIPTERKEKKGHKPVRKTQKIAQLSSPYFKSDGANTISTTSWRDGQRLAKKILGPVPKLEQSNTQILSSDRSEKDKFIKSDCRSSSQNKESCFRKPLRVTTLDSNVSKNGHVEFRQPLASFRDSRWSPSCKTSCQLEDKRLKYKEAGNKAEGIGMIYDKGEPDLHGRDLKSSSSTNETVVRYLNDHTAIYALQSSDVVNPTKLEEEKSEESRGDEYTKISPSSIIQNELKELQLVESSTSSASTSSAHRLDILKQHQHDDKLEKLKERIRKQWECPEELTTRGHDPEYSDYPITVAAPENIVTPKVRKVAIAPMAPSYKGFNPSEAKIRTPDGKVWCEEEFLNLSRELCRDLEFQLAEEDLPAIKIPTERKKKKGHKPVRKTQKIAQLSSPYFKSDGANTISTTSWRDGQRLAKKILGPVPKLEQSNTQILSNDRSEKDKFIKSVSSAQITETDCNMPVAVKPLTKCPERSWSKIRAKNNLKKKDAAPHNGGLGNHPIDKYFLPVEIRGILDDLQLDSVVQDSERRNEECQNQESEPSPFSRSHSPSKKKSDKVPISEDTQFILKKRHYDADEVRQYIMRQQEERKKRQSEEKKAQKEATEQKNKRLKELYKKQKEAVASKTKTTSTSETVTKQLQETYSKLFLEQTLLENPALSVQEVQSKPGYQPSGESDKENKAQERPVSASSSSDMSLSEPPHPLIRDNTLEPLRIHPEKLNSVAQVPCSKSVLNGALFSQLLSLDNMGILQKDFESVTSSRRSHNTAMGSLSSTPQPFMSSTVQPTINHYKHKLDRIEALKATAASLSNRIESEAKKLAGAGINYEAAWDTEHDLLQRDQGDTCWAKASSPPVREDDVFSTRLQKMLATCNSHTIFDDNLPGVGNLNEFKKLPETISPHAGALGLPDNNTTEGILGNPSQKQACPAGPENKPAVLNDSGSSLSEGLLSTGFLSEEGEKSNNPPLKIAEALNEKEFCVADKTGFEPIKEFQKEAENYLPIFTQIRNGPKPWEELVKGSPHSVINIFVKSYQLCGKESEEHAGQGPSTHRPLLPDMSPPDSIASYEDEFISSQGSGTSMDKKSTPEHSGTSSSSLKEEPASKKLPYEHQTMELTHHSSRSPSSGSSRTSTSSKRRGRKEKTDPLNGFPNASLREESKVSPGPDYGLEQAKHLLSNNTVSSREQEVNPDSDNSLEELSGHSLMSLPDKVRSPRMINSAQSPNIQKKMDPVGNTAEKHRSLNCSRNIASGSVLNPAFSDLSIGNNRTGTNILNGSMRFSPAGLQHRMSAELNYLSTIEQSIHQISDIERVQGISLAQQESVSLALILKSQQQRHERDLTLLKLKAEQELLENQRNLEEAKQKAAQAHAESLHHLAHSHQEAAETLQETTSKIATHQLETALLIADTARQIREMTELARFHISDAVGNTAAPVTTLFDQEQKHNSAFIKQLKLRNMNRKADSITTPPGKEETNDSKHHDLHAFDSYSESSRSKAHYQSSSSSRQESPSSKEAKKLSHHEKPSSSIEEEAPTAMNDSLQNNSIPSVPDERDSTSIATEYSLKFDESMTEDKIEEQSFRSLLPSESHRRINLKKRSHQVYSDEEASPEKSTLSPIKELNLPFSGGQDSFSKFTMEMVRQYMREEEMRAAHQSSLLRLHEKALKEKTKAELAWLEHQKRHLRDKGEDDKMPPIRKKQRGLLLKLQQEKAEIKRLQEANKAARKERQLILKQQEEIERIRQTTMKLQEKLKSSGENKERRSEDDKKQTHSSSPQTTDAEAYSPSSISSSDTSSIMQKLKKMRRRMDEKFLTKREQKLMQRCQHAEELLQWKQRLDTEEAEIRQIEKQALAAWGKELHKTKANKKGAGDQKSDQKDVVPSSEQSVSVNIMKFTEAEIQSEKQSHTASAVLKTLRKSTAESDDLDSLLSSAILKDLGNTSKISPTSLNKTEDAVSYDPQDTRSIVQETAESKELEVEIASRASEISDASVFYLNQNNSISLKTEVPPETELSEKDQFVLECISVQEIKEMPSKRFKDDESIISVKSSGRLGKDKLKGDSLISEKISICEEPSYSNDFEESFLRTDVAKSEIVLTEYQKDTFYDSTLSFKQGIRSQGEKSLYKRPGSESLSFGSDDEISECLSENSLSVADSIHSERLLELKSPTEFVKNKECGNVEKVPADDGDDSSSQASSFKASSEKQEEDFLLGFSIGDRVLVSNVQPGTLKFKGRTNFAKGFWAGVELDEPEGNNNGSYNDIQYFDCKEKHGIFAPSQKISHFPESFGNELDSNENSFFNRELDNQHKTNQKGLECLEEEKNKRNSNEKSPRESSALEGLIGAGDYVKFNKSSGYVAVINTVDEFDQETGDFDAPKSSKNDNGMLPSAISNIHKEDSAIEVGEILDSSFPEKWKQQSVWQEQIENRFSPTNLEKCATPLLDLLTKERSQLEAQLKVPSQEKEDLLDRQERVGLLADSLLQGFVKDTVSQFQQIKKARNEKIHFSNQELGAVQEKKLTTNEQQRFLVVYELDDGEELSSPDMCPRPESPVFGASGQEELAKRLAELELSWEILNVLGDDQDWFDEDFGLSSHMLPQNQAEESAVLPKIKLPKVSPKPYEEPLAVPYVAEEVEELVHAAAEKLWKCKELGHDLQALSSPRGMNESPQNDDIETISKEIYKQAVFDLTREIFEEIFAEDPNLNQPLWMKPSRIISGYFRQVKDPSDLEEIKVFITTEVLKLLNLRKGLNNKTDWQKMMKFGRKKKVTVDHILVQELHEEEAQWVNYDEDELYVKMQLADDIFEALIRETIDLLNQITEKQKLLLV